MLFGKRLAQIRQELAVSGEDNWTQTRVAEETGVTTNQIARLEHSNAGSIETFVAVLTFYHRRGYNLNWILQADNANTPKRVVGEATRIIDAHLVFAKLADLKEVIVKQLDGSEEYLKNNQA